MVGKRAYTILVVDSGARIRKRFRVTHRTLVGAIAGTVSLTTVGIICGLVLPPLVFAWLTLHTRVDRLEMQNRVLVEERARLAGLVAEVGDKLERFESDAMRLKALAEMTGGKLQSVRAGGPQGDPAALASQPVLEDLARLNVRSDLLAARLNAIEEQLLRRAEKISALPLLWPAAGAVGDGFGWRNDPFTGEREFHRGLDIQALYGSPVLAPASGVVIHAGYATGYGLSVCLSHTPEIETRFGHLSRLAALAGERVVKGQILGYVGNTGRSSGPHLHYEVLLNGAHVDPIRFLKSKAKEPPLRVASVN